MNTINGKPFTTWSLYFEKGTYATLLEGAGIKKAIENESSVVDGKQILYVSGRTYMEPRTLTIVFIIHDKNALAKYKEFIKELQKGKCIFVVPSTGETYRLNYVDFKRISTLHKNVIKFQVEFIEVNPNDRAN